tara:strand:- start:375 stop:1094 length:720 start_codon:yes stop_codon:yes gene_type:complete
MAFLGDFGKLFGLGTTGQFVTTATGNPGLGMAAQAGANILSPVGGKIEEAIANRPQPPVENPGVQNIPMESGIPEMGASVVPASFNPTIVNAPMIPGTTATQASLPLVTGVGGAVVATIADFIIDQFGNQKKLIITRRLKSKTRQLFNDLQGNIPATAEALSVATGKRYSAENVMKILTHKLRNDGPMISKASIRNGRKLINRLKSMEMIKKELCGTRAPVRRRKSSSMRAGTTTLIKN